MNALNIVNTIIDLHKDCDYDFIKELLVSKANISDLPFIAEKLEHHKSSNEMNSADMAIDIINNLLNYPTE